MPGQFAVYTLFSGSSGNAVYIKYGSAEILIDAGVSAKAICEALCGIGTNIDNIAAIFVTHEHIDHVRGLAVLTKKHPIPVYMTAGVLQSCIADPACPLGQLSHAMAAGDALAIGEMLITSFPTPHDSAESVGYTVRTPLGTVGLATDIGHLTPAVKKSLLDCDHVILEANYDEHMLMTGPYPYPLRMRIASDIGHLSNSESAVFASALAQHGTKSILLAHLSKENNSPDLAYAVVRRELELTGVADRTALAVAGRDRPTKFVEI